MSIGWGIVVLGKGFLAPEEVAGDHRVFVEGQIPTNGC